MFSVLPKDMGGIPTVSGAGGGGGGVVEEGGRLSNLKEEN